MACSQAGLDRGSSIGNTENYLPDLGLGEREAIDLASKIGADALLMDDANRL